MLKKIEKTVQEFLEACDLKGENFRETPKRVSKFWGEFFNSSAAVDKIFPLKTKPGMIIIKGITLWGFCPHHLLPVKYTIKIGYIPETTPLGASKPVRLAQMVLSSFPLQEEIPELLVELVEKAIKIKGAGCIVQGEHLCMQMRGVKQPCSSMVTSFMSGVFFENQACREEFLLL